MVRALVSICFGNPRLRHTIKKSGMKLQTDDSEIRSILIFQKEGLGGLVSTLHLCMITDYSCLILLTDQILLSDGLITS